MEQVTPKTPPPVDLSKIPGLLNKAIWVSGFILFVGAAVAGSREQFAHSWLVAFMFCLSFGLGGLFLVLTHHLSKFQYQTCRDNH